MGKGQYIRNDNNVLTPFKFHDNRLQSNNDIAVRFAASVPVIVFVIVAGLEVLGELLGNFLVLQSEHYRQYAVRGKGISTWYRHAITHAAVKLVERFPL